jgi:hypothetical protein
MENFSFKSLLQPDKKVNVVVRLLAIPLSILTVIVFADSLHRLMFDPQTLGAFIKKSFDILLLVIVFWPFSYVAIKGKNPKHWHPYQ